MNGLYWSLCAIINVGTGIGGTPNQSRRYKIKEILFLLFCIGELSLLSGSGNPVAMISDAGNLDDRGKAWGNTYNG